jgi:D-3-phosphoglycerate dehydrogenase
VQKKVLIVTPTFVEKLCLTDMILQLNNEGFEIKTRVYEEPISERELINLIKDMDGYISGIEKITSNVLDHANKLKIIAQFGVGTDNIDLKAANKKNIIVSNAKGANSYSVAEITISLMLSLIRDITNLNNSVKLEKKWIKGMWHEMKGKTLGIIGLGNVGKNLAKLANCMNMKIVAYDIVHDDAFVNKYNIDYLSLENLLEMSDFVSLHVPLDNSTKKMIAKKELDMMKSAAFLLNLARGGIVDENCLYRALKNKKIAGAALDVLENEKVGENKLFELDNIIVLPHIAANTYEAVKAVGDMVVENIIEGLIKGKCSRMVNNPF